MTTAKLMCGDLIAMQKEKGNVCVSVIVPTHRILPDRRTDAPELEKAIHAAIQTLEYKYGNGRAKPLAENLYKIYNSIDLNHNEEGIGLYISSNIELVVKFPFPVKEKIIVGDSFEIRDLLYKDNFSDYYYVLMISEKEAKLFRGVWETLTEITDEHFPMYYEEEYDYSQPARSTSYSGHAHVKNFERDKPVLEETRHKEFFRKADNQLGKYITGDAPLIVAGPGKEPGWFEKISKFNKHIVGEIRGNYSHHSPVAIAALAWPVMFENLQMKRAMLLKELEEKFGGSLAVRGIQDVWQAAKEGRCLNLLVEKDYRCPGFLDKQGNHIYLRPPRRPHIALADAVDDLLEIVLNKKGRIYFTDNDMLKDHQRIAMITRY